MYVRYGKMRDIVKGLAYFLVALSAILNSDLGSISESGVWGGVS
jgi:hypothetical protein